MDNPGNFLIEPVASRTRARAGIKGSKTIIPSALSTISGRKRKPRPISSTTKPKPTNAKVPRFSAQPSDNHVDNSLDRSNSASAGSSSAPKLIKNEPEDHSVPSYTSAQVKSEIGIVPGPELQVSNGSQIKREPIALENQKQELEVATAVESQKSKSNTDKKKKRAKKVVKAEAVPEISPEQLARREKKAGMILQKLTEIYPEAPKGFLDHTDAFTLLCAVVLSAQCTDAKVNSVTPGLFAAAPTPQAMIDLGIPRIKELIASIGLTNSKAKYLYQLSTTIVEQHDGNVPGTLEELENLSGVGHKTASVVASQFFGVHAFPVDTHIHRLACRWGIGDARSVERTEAALKRWFNDPTTWQDLHTRIIKFGREHCPATKHDMDECPICSFAATTESRRANASSGRKFIAAVKHKDPYQLQVGPVSSPYWSNDKR